MFFCFVFQQFGAILDVEIIFNERGSKVSSRWQIHNFPFNEKLVQFTDIISLAIEDSLVPG